MANRRQSLGRKRVLAAAVFGVLVAAASGPVLATLSHTWTADADFAAGTFSSTVGSADSVTLATEGVGTPDPAITWWDSSWGQRRCIDVTNNEAAALTEYQIRVEIDTATPIAGARMDAGGDDVRFIGSNGTTELDYWIEGPLNSATTVMWVQTDTLPPGSSTVCMYYDNAAATAQSDPFSPFTYATPQPLYVAVAANQAGRPLAVASYVDGNVVSDGISTVTLNAGDTNVFAGAGHTAITTVTATGPISTRGTGSEVDTYAPLAFAGTNFVIPTGRDTNQLSLYAPFANSDVTIIHGATTTNVTVPVGTSLTTATDVPGVGSILVSSTTPVLVTHLGGTTGDAHVAVPAADEPIFGIRSTIQLTGYGTDGTTVTIRESDGTSVAQAGSAGAAISRGGGGSQGTGPAVRIDVTAGGPVGGIQQADSDGLESTTYWPRSELNTQYRVATVSQYAAMSCPTQGQSIDADGTTLSCTGTGGGLFPGKALVSSALVAGDLFESLDGTPFYLYAEDIGSNDEANVLGAKQARLNTLNPPTFSIGAEESPHVPAGTWTSAAHDAGCTAFFETLSWDPLSNPASTTMQFQIATAATAGGPFNPLGPDGTAATFYTNPVTNSIPAVHDGDRFMQVIASLATSNRVVTPILDAVTVDWEGGVTVSGALFNDIGADGTRDVSDPGIVAIDVELWRDDGDSSFDSGTDTLEQTTPSGAGGGYAFTPVRPGVFFVRASEAQLDPSFIVPGTTPHPVGPITLADCGTATADIGWQQGGQLTTLVFSDVDNTSTFGGPDTTLNGIPVQLWSDNGNGSFDSATDTLTQTVITAGGGLSDFGVLPPGTYFTRVAPGSEPAGHNPVASTPNPAGPFTIVGGSDLASIIGFVPSGALSGTAFGDIVVIDGIPGPGEPGIGGLIIDLWTDNGDGIFGPGDVRVNSVVTDADGLYDFNPLGLGDYWLIPASNPSPYLPAAPVLATVSGVTARDIPFVVEQVTVSGIVVSGTDSVPDSSDTPLAGVTVWLWIDNGDGLLDRSTDTRVATTTGADGRYRFDGLAPGSFFVEVDTDSLPEMVNTIAVGSNPIGPLFGPNPGVSFSFAPIEGTLPETGPAGFSLILLLGTALLVAGAALTTSANRRRFVALPTRRPAD